MMKNSEPWNINIKTRIDELNAAHDNGKKIAIIIYPNKDLSSSFRYRAYNIYQATKKSENWQLIYFFLEEINEVIKLIEHINLIILGRMTEWLPIFDELAIIARRNNINIVQDLDDCVCGIAHIKETYNIISPDIVDQSYWIKTSAQMEMFSNISNGFLVTNNFLGETLSDSHNGKPFATIPNFLNNEQIDYSEKVLKNEKKNNYIIGYFSGSHTHATDFEVVYPEIIQLLEDNPNLKLRIVGMLQLPKSSEKLLKSGRIEYVKMVNFLELQKLVSEVDINIAPLADNVFTNCKSELKFFEAALVKTPTIASPTYAFSKAIKNGETGMLCRPGEWTDAINYLYHDQVSSKEIAENAYKYIKKHYYPEAVIKKIDIAYDELCK